MSNCTLEPIEVAEGRTKLICSRCAQVATVPSDKASVVAMQCLVTSYGPGSELTKIIAALGVEPIGGCSCTHLAVRMDNLGVSGCIEQRESLIAEMRQNYAKYSWLDVIKAAPNAIGLIGSVNPLDPVPGLINAAIERAEVNAWKWLHK